VRASEVFDWVKRFHVLSRNVGVKYRNIITVLEQTDETSQIVSQHIPMPSPITDRELIYSQSNIRLANGDFLVAFKESDYRPVNIRGKDLGY
jgi:hypothetical protein